MPNFTFYGGRKRATTKCFFLSLNLRIFLRNSTPGGLACIWQRKWVTMIAMKIERARRFRCGRCPFILRSLILPTKFLYTPSAFPNVRFLLRSFSLGCKGNLDLREKDNHSMEGRYFIIQGGAEEESDQKTQSVIYLFLLKYNNCYYYFE